MTVQITRHALTELIRDVPTVIVGTHHSVAALCAVFADWYPDAIIMPVRTGKTASIEYGARMQAINRGETVRHAVYVYDKNTGVEFKSSVNKLGGRWVEFDEDIAPVDHTAALLAAGKVIDAACEVILNAWTDRHGRLHGHASVIKLEEALKLIPKEMLPMYRRGL